MVQQIHFQLPQQRRGAHLVTRLVEQRLGNLPDLGFVNLFLMHTSAALTINENADPSVRTDLTASLDRLVKEREPFYTHTYEGDDDMPAHIKSSLLGVSLTIPISGGRLHMGTWQGIYLCEFRETGGARNITATIYS
jgi:secondary thiamine-phosphate synthase enzyme